MAKKILIVDDSALMRRVLSDIIDTDKRFVQADAANNGLEAYDLIVTNPSAYDLIILDINMPKMNGIQLMEKMEEKNIHIPTLIVSTIAKEGAAETIRCLELGAFDFITKPDSFLETKSDKFRDKIIRYLCEALKMPIEGFTPATTSTSSLSSGVEKLQKTSTNAQTSATQGTAGIKKPINNDGPMSYVRVTDFKKKPHTNVSASANRLVAIACSTGGPKALQQVIPQLPGNLAAPVLLVQHMPEGFTGTLAARLDDMSAIKVTEANDGTVIEKGHVYIAKGGKHLRLRKKGRDYVIELGSDEPRNSLRPCADIMYESLTSLDFDEITCVVLTGMGSDGTRGIGQLCSSKNCYVIAQDEASSTVYGMPRMIKEAGITDEVVTLNSIAKAITNVVGTC